MNPFLPVFGLLAAAVLGWRLLGRRLRAAMFERWAEDNGLTVFEPAGETPPEPWTEDDDHEP